MATSSVARCVSPSSGETWQNSRLSSGMIQSRAPICFLLTVCTTLQQQGFLIQRWRHLSRQTGYEQDVWATRNVQQEGHQAAEYTLRLPQGRGARAENQPVKIWLKNTQASDLPLPGGSFGLKVVQDSGSELGHEIGTRHTTRIYWEVPVWTVELM